MSRSESGRMIRNWIESLMTVLNRKLRVFDQASNMTESENLH
jgi:hypothetical protein